MAEECYMCGEPVESGDWVLPKCKKCLKAQKILIKKVRLNWQIKRKAILEGTDKADPGETLIYLQKLYWR